MAHFKLIYIFIHSQVLMSRIRKVTVIYYLLYNYLWIYNEFIMISIVLVNICDLRRPRPVVMITIIIDHNWLLMIYTLRVHSLEKIA